MCSPTRTSRLINGPHGACEKAQKSSLMAQNNDCCTYSSSDQPSGHINQSLVFVFADKLRWRSSHSFSWLPNKIRLHFSVGQRNVIKAKINKNIVFLPNYYDPYQTVQYNTIPYHTLQSQYNTIPYNTIPYVPYTIPYIYQPYHTIYHTILYHTIPYQIISYTIPYIYHTKSYHTISYHTISHIYHTISYHIPYYAYHTTPYHTTPYLCLDPFLVFKYSSTLIKAWGLCLGGVFRFLVVLRYGDCASLLNL